MIRLSILVLFAFSSGVFAQETTCVTRKQFLGGEFSYDSVPCKPTFAAPLKYCNADPIDPLKSIDYLTALDFREYLLYIDLQKDADVATDVVKWDGLRLYALLDEKNPEDVAAVFFVLSTAILSEKLTELATMAEVEASFQSLVNRDIERRFFVNRLPQSISKLERIFRCVVRCGDVEADIEVLTRSQAFASCAGE